jgi:uridine kinase
MTNPSSLQAAETIAAAVRKLARKTPIAVAIDGASGSGKSTVAALAAQLLGAAHLPADDFYAANITDAGWAARTAAQKAADAIDWDRLRRDALLPLLAGKPARWQAFDFSAGPRGDGTYALRAAFIERAPAAVVLVDGAYAAAGAGDLCALTVLVDAPRAVRHGRLAAREEAAFLAAWHARWDEAEDYYFVQAWPLGRFGLVVSNK